MPELSAYLLGLPRFECGGVPLKPARRKVSALLAYLAETATRHDRGALTDLLYPEQDGDRARSDFRQTLSILKQTLGEGWLVIDRDGVSLCPTREVWVDVHEFRRLVGESQSLAQDQRAPEPLERLAEAARLYRGEFLSGLYVRDSRVFEEWQEFEQDSLRRDYALLLQQLVRRHLGRGEYRAAMQYGERWLALDTLDQAVHREMMRLCCLAGQPGAALRQYESCRSILAKQLGEAPDAETERLLLEIKSCRGRPWQPAVSPWSPGSDAPEGADESGLTGSLPASLYFLVAALESGSGRECHLLSIDAPWKRMIEARGTLVPDGRDDVLCAVFPTVLDALCAATEAAPSRSQGGGVRLALHAAVADRWDARHLALASAKATALVGAGHGAQILLSGEAAECAREALPPGASIRPLGVHRLRDLSAPQQVYELVRARAAHSSCRLRSLDLLPNNLSSQPTPLVGRRGEVQRLIGLLEKEEVRLLTLTGPGGSGKTRLAVQAGAAVLDRFEHGAFMVDLSVLRDPTQLCAAVAAVLDIPETPNESRPALRVLTDYLEGRELLLILDNFEHLLPAAGQVVEVLAVCRRLKVLATSREPLHLRGELQYAVLPLDLPASTEPAERLMLYGAVQLFMERAQAVRQDLSAEQGTLAVVAEICRRLDGLPLALELAAARVKVLSPQALVQMVDHRLGLVSGGSLDLPARQRSLESELDWSFELLDDGAAKLFRRLSVFSGGCTIEGARAVCFPEGRATGSKVLDGLSSLVDKSLLREEERAGSPRFRMLETIREYAAEKLDESGERERIEGGFALHVLDTVEELERGLYGPDQMLSFDRLDAEYGNIRKALAWMQGEHRAAHGVRLAGALGWYWFRRGRFTEGYRWLDAFVAASGDAPPAAARATALHRLGWIRRMIGVLPFDIRSRDVGARDCFRESLRLSREAGDTRGVAMALGCLGWAEADLPWEARWDLMEQSVRAVRETLDPWATAFCLKMAYSYVPRGDRERGFKEAVLRECIALARQTADRYLVCLALHGMGDMLMFERDDEAAEPWYLESLQIARELDDKFSRYGALSHLGFGYLRLARRDRAEECFVEGLRLAVETGARSYLGTFLGGLAMVALQKGMPARSARLRGAQSAAVQSSSVLPDPKLVADLGLDEATVRAEWSKGRAMSSERAVGYALGDPEAG